MMELWCLRIEDGAVFGGWAGISLLVLCLVDGLFLELRKGKIM